MDPGNSRKRAMNSKPSLRQYHVNDKIDRLRSVMLGTFFYPEYFSQIKNPRVREPLKRVSEEINNDLDQFESMLKAEGCHVVRTVQPRSDIDCYANDINSWAPRNNHVVIGNKLVQLATNPSVTDALVEYESNILDLSKDNQTYFDTTMSAARSCYNAAKNVWYSRKKYDVLAGSDWPSFEDFVQGNYSLPDDIRDELAQWEDDLSYWTDEMRPLSGPNVMVLHDKIIVDSNEYCAYDQWLGEKIATDRPISKIITRAWHTDGIMAILGNNTIIGGLELIDYESVLPGYHVIDLPGEPPQFNIPGFQKMKERVDGRWWIPGEEENPDLIAFVEHMLSIWVGNTLDSKFGVNVLPLDANTIFVSHDDPDIKAQLKARGIETILVPWRHSFFIDHGLHCITLDLERR